MSEGSHSDGRIIRIFDATTVAINLGSEANVKAGTRFGIFTPPADIVDPVTGDTLGAYQQRKGVVIVKEVHDRFSIASTPTVRQEYTEETTGFGLGSKQRRTRQVEQELEIEYGATQPMPSGDAVKVGDLVLPLSR